MIHEPCRFLRDLDGSVNLVVKETIPTETYKSLIASRNGYLLLGLHEVSVASIPLVPPSAFIPESYTWAGGLAQAIKSKRFIGRTRSA